MSRDTTDAQSQSLDWNVTVSERTLPIYPSTPTAAVQGRPSEYTNVSGVTPKVSDYGRGVRQSNRNEPQSPEPSDDILRGIDIRAGAEPGLRPRVIDNEDVRVPIGKLLNNALKPDKCNSEKRFLPCGELESICSKSAVYSELQRHFGDVQAKILAEFVCEGEQPAKEIFAILVLIHRVDFISKFKEAGLCDADLPFSGSEEQTKLSTHRSRGNRPIAFFEHSKDAETMREFYCKQWWVHVPFLGPDRCEHKAVSYLFEPGTVLPWTFMGEKIENGGYGRVQEVKIHEDHHSFSQCKSFALKTLHPEYQDDNLKAFKQEISAFRKMRPGPHLVELCADFRIGDSFMLIFPWAEGGSLERLWKTPSEALCAPFGLDTTAFVRWIAGECEGLIRGLERIHDTRIKPQTRDADKDEGERYYGIHGDIKPANILHFSQGRSRHPLGTLKVADFGLMKFHHRRSRTKNSPNTAGAASQTYRSPEHDIDQTMSKKVEIWAMGCVFSELLTWVIRDPDARKEYEDRRLKESLYSGDHDKGDWKEDSFFTKHVTKRRRLGGTPSLSTPAQDVEPSKSSDPSVKHAVKKRISRVIEAVLPGPNNFSTEETPKLKASVSKWIGELILDARDGDEQTFLTKFLQFIRDDMLHPQRTSRADCNRVLGFFKDYIVGEADNPRFWSLQHPKSPVVRNASHGVVVCKDGRKGCCPS